MSTINIISLGVLSTVHHEGKLVIIKVQLVGSDYTGCHSFEQYHENLMAVVLHICQLNHFSHDSSKHTVSHKKCIEVNILILVTAAVDQDSTATLQTLVLNAITFPQQHLPHRKNREILPCKKLNFVASSGKSV